MGEEPKAVKTLGVWPNSDFLCACGWVMDSEWRGPGKIVAVCYNEKCDRRGVLLVVKPIELEVYDAT